MHKTDNVKILTHILHYWILGGTSAFWDTETVWGGGASEET